MLAAVIDLAVLGLLQEQPLHGYELKKRLGEMLGALWGVSYGSLYPALRRLAADGAIEEIDAGEVVAGPAAPPTGSLSGDLAAARRRHRSRRPSRRTRRAYRLTAHGRARFAQLLAEDGGADDERDFALRLSFCRHLPDAQRLAFLERRRAHLLERLASARRGPARPIDRYTRALAEHRARTTEHDLAWIDDLIAAERGELPAPRTEGAPA